MLRKILTIAIVARFSCYLRLQENRDGADHASYA